MTIPQGKKIGMCAFLCAVTFNWNHGIRLKTRMPFFIWPTLFLCNTKVNINYCVGVKEKRPKISYRNQDRDSEAKNFNIKTKFRCYTNRIWEFVANVKQEWFTFRFGHWHFFHF